MRADTFVIATFFPGEQRGFWSSEQGRSLLGAGLRSLAEACGSAPALAITCAPEVLRPVLPAGFEVVVLDGAGNANRADIFPTGPVQEVMRAQIGGRAGTVLCVDLLHAFPFQVQGGPFGRAVRLSRERGALVIGVEESVDHPCQFVRAEKNSAVGQVRLFEDPADAARILGPDYGQGLVRLTKPFPCNWSRSRGVAEAPGAAHVFDVDTGAFVPALLTPDADEVLWLWAGPASARLVFCAGVMVRAAEAWAVPDVSALAGWSLETCAAARLLPGNQPKGQQDEVLVLAQRLEAGVLRLWAAQPAEGARLGLTPLGEADGAREYAGHASGMCIDTPSEAVPGFRFVLCVPGQAGRGDHLRHFEPQDSPWSYRWQDGATTCATTGNAIMGRQDFIPVHTVRAELMAFPAGQLAQWPPKLSECEWLGLVGGAGLRIDNDFQALRYTARAMARAHESNG